MLFSELNRINLNVLIQDTDYEVVPDISSDCYVHNKDVWTLFVNEHYEDLDDHNDELVINIPKTTDDLPNGWKVHDLHSEDLQDSYLYFALDDISKSLVVRTDKDSDIVKIYTGQFEADGTLNYRGLIEEEEHFHIRNGCHHHPKRGDWWTFSNGAFQWIGGWPKSIYECRFSYGPFCGMDPHHFDNNHEMLDKFNSLSILPNLVFVFDELHTLKGIVSLPCGREDILEMTRNYITNLLIYSSKYKMSFKNFDNILKEYSQIDGYIPTIKIIHKHSECEKEEKPVIAIFDITQQTQDIRYNKQYKYILPNTDNMSMFLGESIWNSYRIDLSFNIPSVKPIGKFEPPPYDPLDEYSTMENIEEHVNNLQGAVTQMYGEFKRYNLITTLSENSICKPIEGNKTTALLTISDMFKFAKTIRKIKDDGELDFSILVLPERFCNKETLNFITNVRYP